MDEDKEAKSIYLDLILIWSAFCNFSILLLTKMLTRNQAGYLKIIIGTIMATCMVPVMIYFPHSFFHSFIGKVLYSILIVYSSFRIPSWKALYHVLTLFYFNAFAIGGGIFALHYLSQTIYSTKIPLANVGITDITEERVSMLLIITCFIICFFFTKKRMDNHAIEKLEYDDIYQVLISINGKQVITKGLFDSGNHLQDPLSQKPIIVCDTHILKQFFKEQHWSQIKHFIENNASTDLPAFLQKKISIVPYQTVEGKLSYLYTLKPDFMRIHYLGQEVEVKKCLIGIQLASLTADARYHCLLHPEIMQKYQLRIAS